MWFPLLSLRSLELGPEVLDRDRKVLGHSRKAREWAVGSLLWFTWRMRMKEVHSSSMAFSPHDKEFQDALTGFMDEYKPSLKEMKYACWPNPFRPDIPPLVPVSVECSGGEALR